MSNADSTARLAAAAERLHRLGAEARKSLSRALTHTAREILAEEFARAHGPDGGPWAPLRRGGRKPLEGTHRLERDFEVTPTPSGFAIRTRHVPDEIVRAHNEGAQIPAREGAGRQQAVNPRTGRFLSDARARKRKLVYLVTTPGRVGSWHLPQRQIIPAGPSLPEHWGARLNATGAAWMRQYLKGGAGG